MTMVTICVLFLVVEGKLDGSEETNHHNHVG